MTARTMGGVRAERRELDLLFSAAYEELRRLAAAVKRGDRGQTLNPTGLVNEAWVRLARAAPFAAVSTEHFKRIAARAMRQVLVDAARRRQSQKRGGEGAIAFVAFDADRDEPETSAERLVQIDEELKELGSVNGRQAQIVECRFFAGMTVEETAAALDVSKSTVEDEWRTARAWLKVRLKKRS